MLYLAIDQHSKQLTVNLRNEAGEILLRRQVSTRGDAPRQFLAEVQVRSAAEGGYVTIVEVCGFNDWLLELLPQCGCRETVLVQADCRSQRKTDRRDANKLGELLWVNRQRAAAGQPINHLRRVRILTRREREDRRVTQLRRNIGRELTRTINSIKTILRRENLEQHCPTKGIQTQAAAGWLKKLALRRRSTAWRWTSCSRGGSSSGSRSSKSRRRSPAGPRPIPMRSSCRRCRAPRPIPRWAWLRASGPSPPPARVAVMRRLATIIWHLLKKREAYQIGGPPHKKLKRHVSARPETAPT